MSEQADGSAVPVEARAERLKERVYVTFTALAVALALRSHAESAGTAIGTLLIAVLGTVLAVFVADVVSHIAAHAALPDRGELRHMTSVSFGSLSVLVVPFILVGLAAADVWQLEQALRATTFVLVATLVAVGYVAVRRVRLPVRQKLVVLFGEFALGVLVVLLELLAHG
jgi:hypothetical protein